MVSLEWTAQSHPGRKREKNEDRFLALTFDGHSFQYLGKIGHQPLAESDFVFAVSDGMGGAQAGEFASRLAVEKITRWLPRGFRSQLSGMEAGFMDLFHELYEDIHDALLYLGANDTDCEGMGATLTLAWFTPGWMYYAHIGDSRIYYLTPGDPLKQLSHDDSYVGWLFRQGKINEREARMHPQRRLIQRALGAGHQFVVPQVGAVGLAPGDRFLLCSDGLVDGLWNHQMESVLNQPSRNGETTAETLVREAVENSGDDNVTAIVVDVARVA